MKAAIYKEYGSPQVLQIADIPTPAQKDNEVLIRNYATAVNSGDWKLRKADPWAVRLAFGLFRPKQQILGSVFAGIVEQAGKNVSKFRIGDRVFGMTGMKMGAYATYLCVEENSPIDLIPDHISFEQAASVPFGGTAALHFLQKCNIQSGQRILIYGASGALGTAAVQIAKHYGAEVTAVSSGTNKQLLTSLGADLHIDYATEDFSKKGQLYDIIFETVNKISFTKSIECLQPNGTLILAAAGISEMSQAAFKNLAGKQKILYGLAVEKPEEITFLKNLLQDNHFTPVIDRIYPLEDIAAAHSYVEAGHKKGNVVIRIE